MPGICIKVFYSSTIALGLLNRFSHETVIAYVKSLVSNYFAIVLMDFVIERMIPLTSNLTDGGKIEEVRPERG